MTEAACLLVVEDEEDLRSVLHGLFCNSLPGWKVVLAASGVEALGKLEACQPTVILSDYLMPGMNGLELAQRLRVQGYKLPILMMTAFVDDSIEGKIANSGLVQRFLRKPVDADWLVREILASQGSSKGSGR